MRYDVDLDLTDLNASPSLMVSLVAEGTVVLDLGCATGYVARALRARGCRVSGVEMDPTAAEEARPLLERLVIGDLDDVSVLDTFPDSSFDVVLVGDVLEHLRRPFDLLLAVRRLLRERGCVVVSVPNVTHAAIRYALLLGHFRYRPLGLLDATHLRWFTRDSLSALLSGAGYEVADWRRTIADPFATELGITPEMVPPALVSTVSADPDADTYQLIARAVVVPSFEPPTLTERDVRDVSWPQFHDGAGVPVHGIDVFQGYSHLVVSALRELGDRLARADEEVVRAAQQEAALQRAIEDGQSARRELDALRSTLTFRLSAPMRRAYSRLRTTPSRLGPV